MTGWRINVSSGAGQARIPSGAQLQVAPSYVPLYTGAAGGSNTYKNTAVVNATAQNGAALNEAADSATPSVVDRVPIVSHVLQTPSTLTVGESSNYLVNISNQDPARSYSDSVMKVVLPVGVFYDATAGVTPAYAKTPTSGVTVLTPGNGLTVTTETVTDTDGEHQVVVFVFDSLESLRISGQPQERNDSYGFRYYVPVQVLPQAYDPKTTSVDVRNYAYTNDATHTATTMGFFPSYYAADKFDFNPNLANIALASQTSRVATSGGLLIGKLVRSETDADWALSAKTATPGSAQWQVYVSNVLADPVTDLELFDRMPYRGDDRGSAFDEKLAGPVTGNPEGSTIEYSKDATTAANGTWSSDPIGATAVRVRLDTLAPGERFTLVISSVTDASALRAGSSATNSVSASAIYHGAVREFSSNDAVLAVEAAPSMSLVKKTNGVAYNQAPGARVVTGSDVVWTYEVANTGNAPLDQVAVDDEFTDGSGVAGVFSATSPEKGTLQPGETRTFTATAVAVEGQYHNVATATAVAVDDAGVPLAERVEPASDQSWYLGGTSGLAVVKTTNGERVVSAPDSSSNLAAK
ncbi:hypothetical protein G7066_04430 [Leucobacter coleopterorum]|uniref:DUF7507 domain-containing protein n=1 Tax=Leucobacter coleopterorum TaxID=2714933 RepID=A0ABX6JVS4_9MICO|nr:hypothetical protein [Leucobacter coleopterorum]QIM18091.1 hypothetical protein G7066_04430 [Leucobacter coleopterorum]